ncbi:conserved hypothetical protein [Ricinus communis]|uniref:PGG domain-containing protein n=1 Tax=Ricinus communis TaxID=3988 RepID=B9RGX9_RICCO|nr:conserved hypothetical protein [Ricinus communis]
MLIATVSFAAAFTLPDRYNNDGPNGGMPIYKDKAAFKAFLVFDTFAFTFSLGAILFPLTTAKIHRARARYHNLQWYLILAALITQAIAFALGIYVVLPRSNGLGCTGFIVIAVLFVIFYSCWFVDPWANPLPASNGQGSMPETCFINMGYFEAMF